MAGQFNLPRLRPRRLIGGGHRGEFSVAVEQVRVRHGLLAIEQVEANFRVGIPEDAMQQIADAERGVNPAKQRRPPLRHRGDRLPGAIHRHQHDDAGLHIGPRLLHEKHLTGQRGFPRVPRLAQAGPPHRLTPQVVAERAQVPLLERLDVSDARILRALPRRRDGKVRKSLRPHAGLVSRPLLRRHPAHEPKPLHARVVFRQAQGRHVVAPRRARRHLARIMQPARTDHHPFKHPHPPEDELLRPVHLVVKPLLRPLRHVAARDPPTQRREQGGDQENGPSRHRTVE